MIDGLKKLNGLIEARQRAIRRSSRCLRARRSRSIRSAPTTHGSSAWIPGSTSGRLPGIDLKTTAPFHPTIDGQDAIADQVARYFNSAAYMLRTGATVEVENDAGARLVFERGAADRVHAHQEDRREPVARPAPFLTRQGYEIDTAADYLGRIEVQLPGAARRPDVALRGRRVGGRARDVRGRGAQGLVTSLSPFAVGPAAPSVTAPRSPAGRAGSCPRTSPSAQSEQLGRHRLRRRGTLATARRDRRQRHASLHLQRLLRRGRDGARRRRRRRYRHDDRDDHEPWPGVRRRGPRRRCEVGDDARARQPRVDRPQRHDPRRQVGDRRQARRTRGTAQRGRHSISRARSTR